MNDWAYFTLWNESRADINLIYYMSEKLLVVLA